MHGREGLEEFVEVESPDKSSSTNDTSTSQEDSTNTQQASPEDIEPQVEAQLNREAADSETEQAALNKTKN